MNIEHDPDAVERVPPSVAFGRISDLVHIWRCAPRKRPLLSHPISSRIHGMCKTLEETRTHTH